MLLHLEPSYGISRQLEIVTYLASLDISRLVSDVFFSFRFFCVCVIRHGKKKRGGKVVWIVYWIVAVAVSVNPSERPLAERRSTSGERVTVRSDIRREV